MLLVGDIGGTKTALAIISPQAGPRAPLAQALFHSVDYPSLTAVVHEFLAGTPVQLEWACFDVAGPVVSGEAKVTNLPWVINAADLQTDLHLRAVYLLNDLEALANALPILVPADLHTINPGVPVAGGAQAVVAPGTGLGEAFLTWDGARYQAHPSEGGHTDFAPVDVTQDGLLNYLRRQWEHVSWERVCSGKGIPNLYAYLRDSGTVPETPAVAQTLASAADPTPVIIEAALHGATSCALCRATLSLFLDIMAAEAGNLALKVLATGGVYLGGGIPPRLLSVLDPERFMRIFQRKGRLAALLAHMPVQVITTSQAPLIGAARYGLGQAGHETAG